MAKPGQHQTSFVAGELDPALSERIDVKQYYQGVKYMLNAEPLPQGGFRRSAGTRDLSAVRGVVAETAVSLTVAPGGLAGLTTGAGAAVAVAATGVVATITLGVSIALAAVDIEAFSSTTSENAALVVEALVGASWIQVGAAVGWRSSARTRRFAIPPDSGVTASAVRLRVAVLGAPATLTIGRVRVQQAGAASTVARAFDFSRGEGLAWWMVATSGNLDLYRGGAWKAAVPAAWTAADLPLLSVMQRLDTAHFFHPAWPATRLVRQWVGLADDTEWNMAAAPWEEMPQVDYGGSYTATPAQWDLYINYTENSFDGARVAVMLNGEESEGIDIPAAGFTGATVAGVIKTTLEAMHVVKTGIAVAWLGTVTTKCFGFRITFSGAGNEGDGWVMAARVTASTTATANVAKRQKGDAGGEDLISTARGWPACGGFYQDRLVMGGFASKPGAWIASVASDYYNLSVDLSGAFGALLINMDTDGAEAVRSIRGFKHLMFFTSRSEWYVANRTMSKAEVPNLVHISDYGIQSGTRPFASESSILWLSANGASLVEAALDPGGETYTARPISLLASDLIVTGRDVAIQPPVANRDAGRLFIVNDDGTAAIGTLKRSESVAAFSRRHTDGAFLSVAVDGDGAAAAVVRRRIGGVDRLRLEGFADDVLFDGTIEQTGAPTATVAGLGVHEGAAVWALADGFVSGPYLVTSGTITLDEAAGHVFVGRWTAPVVELLPPIKVVSESVVIRRPGRISRVILSLLGSTSIAVGANGRPARDVALGRTTTVVDGPVPAVTGQRVVDGLLGYSAAPTVVITQKKPGDLFVRSITYEMRT